MKFLAFAVMLALAHHSAAGIDRTKSVSLVGTVKQFGWQNPHSWMEVDVPNEAGVVTTWKVEMTSPAFLVRAGWKSTSVKAGGVSTLAPPAETGRCAAFGSATTRVASAGTTAPPVVQSPSPMPTTGPMIRVRAIRVIGHLRRSSATEIDQRRAARASTVPRPSRARRA